ncbi:MAG: hypothetical protein J0L99_05950 [Chitinophagales bacterium]|nr:hypothetical protein [Chitinophagales bacterium]
MITKFSSQLVIIFFLFFQSSCTQEDNFDKYFRMMEQEIGPDLSAQFKTLPEDSVMHFSREMIYPILNETLFKNDSTKQEIEAHLRSKGMGVYIMPRYFMFSFQNYLNNESVTEDSILQRCEADYNRYYFPMLVKKIEAETKANWAALHNYNKYQPGDTLKVVLPLIESYRGYEASFSSDKIKGVNYSYPDSISLTGRLLEEKYRAVPSEEGYILYLTEFRIHVINIQDSIYFYNKLLAPEHEFWLDLQPYGRVLEKVR